MMKWSVYLWCLLALSWLGCAERRPTPVKAPPVVPPQVLQPARAPIPLPRRATVTLSERQFAPAISVEVATTELERNQGLMYRQRLGRHRGMVFLMPDLRDWAFYMRNTLIPLDIIFVGPDWRVVGVVERAVPLTETLRRVGTPSQYVLELDAGEAQRLGIRSGTQLRMTEVER